MNRRRALMAGLVAGALAAAGCGGPTEPPAPETAAPEADAARIYATQACAMCHGESREGGPNGPALRAGDPYWTVERLAEYLRAPDAFRRANAEFDARRSTDYAMRMPAYEHLDTDELRELARWLLEP